MKKRWFSLFSVFFLLITVTTPIFLYGEEESDTSSEYSDVDLDDIWDNYEEDPDDEEDEALPDNYYTGGDADFYSGNYTYPEKDEEKEKEKEEDENSDSYVSHYQEAQAAYEAAVNGEVEVDAVEFQALLDDLEEAKADLDAYCSEHGLTWSDDTDAHTVTFKDENGEVVSRVGDPVFFATGAFEIDDRDYTLSYGDWEFSISRHYSSALDGKSEGGAFGRGWTSILDTRVIRGKSNVDESVIDKWKTLIEIYETAEEEIADYASEDSSCQEFLEKIEEKLLYAREQKSLLEELYNQSLLIDEKNKYVAYGYCATLLEKASADSYVLVDDKGTPFVFHQSEDTYSFASDSMNKRVSISRDDEENLIFEFINGQKRIYNDYGLLVKIQYRNGISLAFNHDSNTGKTSSISLLVENVPVGKNLYLKWDGDRLSSLSDGKQSVSYGYSRALLSSVTDIFGIERRFDYGSDDRISRQYKSDGSYVAFEYGKMSDGSIRVISTTDENKNSEYFSYDVENRTMTYTDHDGVESHFAWDEKGHTLWEHYANGKEISFTYDSDGNLAGKQQGSERETYSYNGEGLLSEKVYQDGSSQSISYDNGLPVKVEDRDGIIQQYVYDGRGNCTSCYQGENLVYSATYLPGGLISKFIDCRKNHILFTYDQRGNLLTKTFFNRDSEKCASEEWTYDELDRISTYKDVSGVSYEYEYTPLSIKISSSLGFETTDTYSSRRDLLFHQEKDTKTGETKRWDFTYDKMHRCTSIFISGVDSSGKEIDKTLVRKSEYTPEGRLSLDWKGNWQQQLFYDQRGEYEENRYGYAQKAGTFDQSPLSDYYDSAWDGTDYISTKTAWDGRRTSHCLDHNGRLIREEKGSSLSLKQDYSSSGRLLEEKKQGSGPINYSYEDGTGFITAYEKKGYDKIEYSWYADGRKKTQKEGGVVTSFFYDYRGRLVKTTSDYKTELWEYDEGGREVSHTILSRDGSILFEEYHTYSKDGRSFTVITGSKDHAIKTDFTTDLWGKVLSKTDALQNSTFYTYDIFGNLITKVGPDGNKTRYTYDGQGKIQSCTTAEGKTTWWDYDNAGNCISCRDERGLIFSASYDSEGNLLSQRKRQNSSGTNYTYDDLNRPLTMSKNETVLLTCIYDDENFGIIQKDALGKESLVTSDGYGNLLSRKNRLNESEYFSYDENQRLKTHTDGEGAVITYDFDGENLTTTLTAPDGTKTVEILDAAGRIIHSENEHSSLNFEYSSSGHLVTQWDELNQEKITFDYDACGRLSNVSTPQGSFSYTYEKHGKIASISHKNLSIQCKFSYDLMGRETERSWSNGQKQKSWYDEYGRKVMTAGFDVRGRVIFVDGCLYDDHDRKTMEFSGNGSVRTFEYDEFDHISSVAYTADEQMTDYYQNLCRENGIQIHKKGGKRFTHHIPSGQYRLSQKLIKKVPGFYLSKKQETLKEFFTYDLNGNLTSRETPFGTIDYSYDDENRLISWGKGCSATYDKNGNMTEKKNLYKTENYSYNYNQRVNNVLIENLLTHEKTSIDYHYDALGRRNYSSSSQAEPQRTSYQGLSMMELYSLPLEQESKKNQKHRTNFAWEKKTASPSCITLYDGNGNPLFMKQSSEKRGKDFSASVFTDSRGSVRSLSSPKDGLISYDYDLFGSPVTSSNPYFGFVGKKYQKETDQYNFGYRDYIPSQARFTTRDPIRDGQNWYSYCAGDSVNYVDPVGLEVTRLEDMVMQDERWQNDVLGDRDVTVGDLEARSGGDKNLTNATYDELLTAKDGEAGTTIGTAGCAVAGVAAAVNALTGSELTPQDINNEKSNFASGTDNINWDAVAQNNCLEHSSYNASKGDNIGSVINALDEGKSQNAVLAQVTYDAEGHTHWVGVNSGVITIDGKDYVNISTTSVNDLPRDDGFQRTEAGWLVQGYAVYVPLDNVARLETYSVQSVSDKTK